MSSPVVSLPGGGAGQQPDPGLKFGAAKRGLGAWDLAGPPGTVGFMMHIDAVSACIPGA